MNTYLDKLRHYCDSLLNSVEMSFIEISKMKKVMGVYVIYSPNNEIIYIGHTNNFHVRFGTDLKHETTHTLVKKLIKQGLFNDRKEVSFFLINKCRYRIHVCENKREAEASEHFCIWALNPKYNK